MTVHTNVFCTQFYFNMNIVELAVILYFYCRHLIIVVFRNKQMAYKLSIRLANLTRIKKLIHICIYIASKFTNYFFSYN